MRGRSHGRRPACARALVHVGLALCALLGAACNDDNGSCKNDYDCAGATVCRVATGACEAFECNTNADCTGGLTCSDAHCHE